MPRLESLPERRLPDGVPGRRRLLPPLPLVPSFRTVRFVRIRSHLAADPIRLLDSPIFHRPALASHLLFPRRSAHTDTELSLRTHGGRPVNNSFTSSYLSRHRHVVVFSRRMIPGAPPSEYRTTAVLTPGRPETTTPVPRDL